jgi:hypothetical protein
MTSTDTTTAVGVFDSETAAARAAAELRDLGFSDGEVGWARGGDAPEAAVPRGGGLGTAGALIIGAGAMAGYGAAFAALFYPAVFTALTGAVLSLALALVAVVVAAGEFARGSLASRRVAAVSPAYATDLFAGRAVVTVRAGGRSEEAMAVLRRHGAVEPGAAPVAAPAA